MKFDVMFFEAFAEEEEALSRFLPPTIKAAFTASTIQEAEIQTIPARMISIRTQSVVPRSWKEDMGALLSRSTGYDHLAAYCRETGYEPHRCGYLPLYCNRAVAEQAMLLWQALLRRLPQQIRQFRTFHRDDITGRQSAGRTLLVTGVGHIGHEVVRIGRGLDMRVLGVDPIQKWDDVDYVTLQEGLPVADVVVCTMNLTSENGHFFDEAQFALMKPGAVFVNVARGELVQTAALRCALTQGNLGGAGLDVYADEPELAATLRGQKEPSAAIADTLALQNIPNVICTPHNAFNTFEAVELKAAQSIDQICSYIENQRFLWECPTP